MSIEEELGDQYENMVSRTIGGLIEYAQHLEKEERGKGEKHLFYVLMSGSLDINLFLPIHFLASRPDLRYDVNKDSIEIHLNPEENVK